MELVSEIPLGAHWRGADSGEWKTVCVGQLRFS